ncbi:MAG TPA: S1 RNA-binding domain-containing protein, partial [Aquificaceae bacterium]|nr:S1 RNA-binding domain-containing protein [Aquificaceae bacterium]
MDVRLIISASESLLLTFILKEGHIHEIKVEKRKARRIAGSVFKGMVRRIAKSLGGAFVDIGLEKEAYLPLKESQAPLKEGSEVIVQVKREPIEDKGAKLTQRVSIPGKYLVYLPTSSHIYVSSKIGDEETRKRLREFFEKSLRGDGVIVRTCARWLDEDVLIQELDFLRKKWESIKESAKTIKTGLVYEEIPLHLQAIRDHWFEIG